MSLEQALMEEIHSISELNNNVFPLKAPEGYTTPYAVFVSSEGVNDKILSGFLSSKTVELELNVICDTYSQMKQLNSEVVQHLQSFVNREIGVTAPIFVQDVSLENPLEFWDTQVLKYKGVIEFKLYL